MDPLGKKGKKGREIPCCSNKKFPAQFMKGISQQVIEAASLSGVASRGGAKIQEKSLLNSLPAGKLVSMA
jgi:hypothetical protein